MHQVNVRFAKSEDAGGILKAHYSAVHATAAKDYPPEVLRAWSTPITDERVERYRRQALPNETTLVAEVDGVIAGFGVIIEANNELRALYVADRFGKQGVGTTLLRELERLAKQRGCTELRMDSSLTAAPFYLRHGYVEQQHGEHTLSTGEKMACVTMRKILG